MALVLDRKSELVDLQELNVYEQAIGVDRERVRRQLGVHARTAPKGMGVIRLDIELFDQLPMHRFNNLAASIEQLRDRSQQLAILIAPRDDLHVQAIGISERSGNCRSNIPFIIDDHLVHLFDEQFLAALEIRDMGQCQHKILNGTVQGDQKVQLITKDGLLLGDNFDKGCALGRPRRA